MAVTFHDSTNNQQAEVVPADLDTNSVGGNKNDYNNSIGFGFNNFDLMSSAKGSDYIVSLSNAIVAHYANLKDKPKVVVFDKKIQQDSKIGLAYSSIVVLLENQAKSQVSYFIILLEDTGRNSLTAKEIINEFNQSMNNPNLASIIYTADDAIDGVLHNHIVNDLKRDYPNYTFISVDGVIVHSGVDEKEIAQYLAAMAYNACKIENEFSTKSNDLNIQANLAKSKGKQFRLETFVSKAARRDELQNPIRKDWAINLNLVDLNNSYTSLNLQNSKVNLLEVAGFVDSVPEENQIVLGYGQQPVNQIRLRPNVVITSSFAGQPTFGFTLLSLISSVVMTQKNMWLAALRPDTANKVNPGALNVLTNIYNNAQGGEKIDLTDKKLNADTVYLNLSEMYSLAPSISFDVAMFGPQTFFTSALSAAAQATNLADQTAARKFIVKTASWLTSGRFPSDFPIDQIFAYDGVVVPLGKYTYKNEERDIRDIDLAFIASHTDDIDFVISWAKSNLPKHVTGVDPYMTKVRIISALIPGAIITGKAVRVTFSAKFITTLEAAAAASGLNVKYEPQVNFTESTTLNIMNNYLNNAGISSGATYAQPLTQAGPNYSTNYGAVWYGRR